MLLNRTRARTIHCSYIPLPLVLVVPSWIVTPASWVICFHIPSLPRYSSRNRPYPYTVPRRASPVQLQNPVPLSSTASSTLVNVAPPPPVLIIDRLLHAHAAIGLHAYSTFSSPLDLFHFHPSRHPLHDFLLPLGSCHLSHPLFYYPSPTTVLLKRCSIAIISTSYLVHRTMRHVLS